MMSYIGLVCLEPAFGSLLKAIVDSAGWLWLPYLAIQGNSVYTGVPFKSIVLAIANQIRLIFKIISLLIHHR